MHSYRYVLNGSACTPADADIAPVKIRSDLLEALVQAGTQARPGQLPLDDLRVASILPQDTDAGEDITVPAEPVAAAGYFADLLSEVILEEVAACHAQHVGVCLSGGLDSSLVLAVLAGLRSTGRVAEVTAFHFTWATAAEMCAEHAAAAAMCAAHDMKLVRIDCGDVTLRDLLAYTDAQCLPDVGTFLVAYSRAAAVAREHGVDLLMTGAGSEGHFSGSDSFMAELDALIAGCRPGTVRRWPVGTGADETWRPPWVSGTVTHAQPTVWTAPTTADHARWLLRLHEFNIVATGVAGAWFVMSRDDPRTVPFGHPYLDPRMLRAAHRLPRDIHRMRVGGEVFDKALLRLALSRTAPASVYLRSSGSPVESVHQNYVRSDWGFFDRFWSQPSRLADLGLIDADWIRQVNSRRALLAEPLLVSTMVLESWLRNHPDRTPQTMELVAQKGKTSVNARS